LHNLETTFLCLPPNILFAPLLFLNDLTGLDPISKHYFMYCHNLSKEERNSWKVAMDLDHVPWKALCKTYGLTLEEIAPPRMNAEGQPVERLDVLFLKSSNKVRCGCLSL